MTNQSTQLLGREYIPPPRLAEVGAASDLAAYLRVLVILASPALSDNPSLNLRAEWQTVSAAVKRQAAPVACYRLTPPTWDALHQALARPGAWPVVHVSAHGDEGGLYLEDEYGDELFVPAERLTSAFIDSQVKLVVLNACSTQNPARALVAAGVPAVVATTAPIDTNEAQRLAEGLYAGLSGGRSITDSLDFARRALNAPSVLVLEAQSGGGEAVLCPEPQPGLRPILSDGLPPRRSALPSPFAFVGRGQELVKIASRLDDPGTRAVRIIGLGGVGKTTLAAEVAHRQAWRFPDGVIWISAQNLPSLGLADLLREIDLVLSLGAGDETSDTQRHVAMEALRDRACLLVVDGLEEAAEGERRALLRFLGGLGAWGRSKAMLVGRLASSDTEALEGSYPLPLDGLAERDALDKLKAEAELKEVGKLLSVPVKERLSWVRAVGYNPAMIEWLVGLRDIERIRHTVRTLPRAYQAKVETLLDSSLDILSPSGHALLLRFPLFVGSADYLAMRAVCGDDLDADVALDELGRASLVWEDRGRYGLHRLVENHVRSSKAWKRTDTTPWHVRLARHYLALARQQRPRLSGPDYRDALALMDADYPNVRAAQAWAVTKGEGELVRDYAYALADYQDKRGLWQEKQTWAEEGLKACERMNDGAGHADMQNNLGNAYSDLPTGDRAANLEKAIACYQEALAIEHLPSWSRIRYLRNLGDCYSQLEDFSSAIAVYQQAINLNPEDLWLCNALGNAYSSQDQHEQAVKAYTDALDLATSKEDKALLYRNRASSLIHLNRLQEAEDDCEEARALDPDNSYTYARLGDLAFAHQNYTSAVEHYTAAIERRPEASFYFDLGLSHLALGQIDQALATCQAGIPLADSLTVAEALKDVERFAAAHPEAPSLDTIRALLSP